MTPLTAPRRLRRHLSLTLGILPLLALLPAQLAAASYYVDYAAGNDANNGSAATSAWQHCPGDPAANGMAAAATLAAGDTVLFKGGVAYVLTGTSGIALKWSGTTGTPITYDGNSAGSWGTGRARLTDNYGSASVSAFFASGNASYLTFKNLDLGTIGGAAALPLDAGTAVPSRFGGGIAVAGAATGVTIDGCVFHDLGYAFNQKPMTAASIAGTGIAFRNATDVAIANCTFSRVAVAIEMTGSTSLTNLTISGCTFSDSIVWTINQPATAAASNVSIYNCVETNNTQFDRNAWTGYGESPRVTVRTVTEGASTTFTASAIATPAPTFQWQKNGTPISGATSSAFTLPAVTLADAGVYTVVATNTAGFTVSNEALLQVTPAPATPPPAPSSGSGTLPTITVQPANVSAAPLGTANFSVTATGSPAPTYQWQKNGVAVSGWTNATLSLVGISTNDIATYTVVVANSAGSVTSNGATLSISSSTSADVAPAITLQPASQTASTGSTVTFSAAASGTPSPTFQWTRNGVALAGATSPTLTLPSVSTSDAGTYALIAANSAGSATSNAATLTVSAPPAPSTDVAPAITAQPISQTAAAGATVTFNAAASGSPAPSFRWTRNGAPITGATSSTLTLTNLAATDAGSYALIATNSAGTATSNSATLTVLTYVAPSFTTQPASQSVAAKSTVKFTAAASGTPAPAYQWRKDGSAIAGATSATLTLTNVNKGSSGSYTVVATNAAGSVVSQAATLTVDNSKNVATTSAITESTTGSIDTTAAAASEGSRLVNLSVRSTAGTGNGSLIVGFVVDGIGDKSLLIRGAGPALADFGVQGAIADPTLSVYSGAALIAGNDDWSASTDAADIAPASARAGAFSLANPSRDAALLTRLATGAYTTQVAAKDGGEGVALLELYDLAPNASARLVNVSVRTGVSAAGAPIIGFVVAGNAPKKLLVRAVGPGLAAFGVSDVLADPTLEIYAGSTQVQSNDDWAGTPELAAAFDRAGAFPLGDTASKDAATLFTAAPGAYTVVVKGANNAAGTVIVELYEMP